MDLPLSQPTFLQVLQCASPKTPLSVHSASFCSIGRTNYTGTVCKEIILIKQAPKYSTVIKACLYFHLSPIMILSGQSKLQNPCTDIPSVATQCNLLQPDCHLQSARIYLNFTVISTISILYMWKSSSGLFHNLFLLAYALRIFTMLASNWNECQLWAFITHGEGERIKKSPNPATFKTMVGHRCLSLLFR